MNKIIAKHDVNSLKWGVLKFHNSSGPQDIDLDVSKQRYFFTPNHPILIGLFIFLTIHFVFFPPPLFLETPIRLLFECARMSQEVRING